MPRVYSKEDLQAALQSIKDGLSFREASKRHSIPRSTLSGYVKKGTLTLTPAGRKVSIPYEVEKACIDAIFVSARAGFTMTKDQVLTRFGRLSAQLGLHTQFKDKKPGDKFWRCLKKRFPQITVRSPECCSHNRMTALTEDQIISYFSDLHNLMSTQKLTPERIWNMDETSLQIQLKATKAATEKSHRRPVSRLCDSKETVTVVACINAAGCVMPPLVIVKGKTRASILSFETYLGPKNFMWTYQQKGLMENSLGVEWFKNIFLPNCGSSRPQLLLLNSHSSHEVLELLELARDENIHIYALPTHTTQPLQPLNTTVFNPLKAAYDRACSDFLIENPCRVVDKKSFPLMLGKAWEVMQNQDLLRKSFSVTGIYPPDRFAISQEQSLPATALDHAILLDPAQGEMPSTSAGPEFAVTSFQPLLPQ